MTSSPPHQSLSDTVLYATSSLHCLEPLSIHRLSASYQPVSTPVGVTCAFSTTPQLRRPTKGIFAVREVGIIIIDRLNGGGV